MKKVKYFDLTPVYEEPTSDVPMIATAALRLCGTCGLTIEGMGGPGNSICVDCAQIIGQGKARGCIDWDHNGDAS